MPSTTPSTRPKNKHQLKVQHFAGNTPAWYIFFKCAHCVTNVAIPRSTMEGLLSGQNLLLDDGVIIFGECHGR